jgi:hypothetical protein
VAPGLFLRTTLELRLRGDKNNREPYLETPDRVAALPFGLVAGAAYVELAARLKDM